MKKYNINDFIEKANKKHHNKYDYSKSVYQGAGVKVCIICPEHGEFWQTPRNHISGQGCPVCSEFNTHNKQRTTINGFIEKARKVHGDKYDYSKVEYINNKTKVCIICPEHGEFWQRPDKHISCDRGCPKCGGTNRLTTDEFIAQAKKIHGDKYDYSKVNYNSTDTKVCIICPEHGEFWQTPHGHLQGQGCPYCKKLLLEDEVRNFLIFFNIKFIQQKRFDWLKNKKKLSLDFYLPEYNIAIECQGIQHFEPVDYFGGVSKFNEQVRNDILKKDLCEKNNIKLLYYTNNNDELITDLTTLKIKIYES